jgi:ABC-type transporter Mla subunit MlaD
MKISNETRTGVFVLICLGALGVLLMRVGNASWFEKGYTLHARFHFVEGVKKNSPVRYCGVDVGDVRAIRILDGDETWIEVDLWVNESVKIRNNSKALVAQLGLMGEKYVEIRAGEPGAPYAKEGDLLPSQDPVRLDDLIDIGKKVAGDISTVTVKIGSAADNVGSLAKNLDVTISENKPKIGNLFDNLEQTSDYFVDFSQDLKAHPWKVLARGKELSKSELAAEKIEWRRKHGKPVPEAALQETVPAAPAAAKQNFASRR